MPELPEVETMRRGILGLVGRRIARFEPVRNGFRPIAISPGAVAIRRRVTDRVIRDVERLGKRVVLVLDDDSRLIFEPRMTGLVLLAAPPDEEHLRVRIGLAGRPRSELLFWDRRGLGSVAWLSRAAYDAKFLQGKLGPDALAIDEPTFVARFAASRRAIKIALLDQQAVAGIGNLYASEILHLARVHPAARCDLLHHQQWSAIFSAMRAVLEQAILYEGSTLGDGTYRNALNQTGSYQNHHRVYDKAGQPCRRCREGAILRIVQAQRSTFFCPGCQTRRRAV